MDESRVSAMIEIVGGVARDYGFRWSVNDHVEMARYLARLPRVTPKVVREAAAKLQVNLHGSASAITREVASYDRRRLVP